MKTVDNVDIVKLAGAEVRVPEAVKLASEKVLAVGDAVGVLVAQWSGVEVAPGFVVGVHVFGKPEDGKTALEVAYLGDSDLKFGTILSDAALCGQERPKTGVVGISPLVNDNDVGLKAGNVLMSLESAVAAKRLELDKAEERLMAVRAFVKRTQDARDRDAERDVA